MSLLYLLYASIVGLAVVCIGWYGIRRDRRRFAFQMFLLAAAALAVHFGLGRQEAIVAKGITANDIYFIILLYFCMFLGMTAHYLYFHLIKPQAERRKQFDWGHFFAPVFISPIIFLPIYASFVNAGIDLATLDGPKLVVFFVAFENGFFWKEYFDNRLKEKQNAGKQSSP